MNGPRSSCLIQMPSVPVARPTPIASRRPSGDSAKRVEAAVPGRVDRGGGALPGHPDRPRARHRRRRPACRPACPPATRPELRRRRSRPAPPRAPAPPGPGDRQVAEIERRGQRGAVAPDVEQVPGRQVPGRHHVVEQQPLPAGAQVEQVHAHRHAAGVADREQHAAGAGQRREVAEIPRPASDGVPQRHGAACPPAALTRDSSLKLGPDVDERAVVEPGRAAEAAPRAESARVDRRRPRRAGSS